MSGRSVRDVTIEEVEQFLNGELTWYMDYSHTHGWLVGVRDDSGDCREWTVVLGKIGKEVST